MPRVHILTEAEKDRFLEDAFNAAFDVADDHDIRAEAASVLLLEALIIDLHLTEPATLRAYVIACLDALDAPEGSAAGDEAHQRRTIHGRALLAALQATADNLTVTEPMVLQ